MRSYEVSSFMYLQNSTFFCVVGMPFPGAAGSFSCRQLEVLDTCVPGGIKYQEPDAQVKTTSSVYGEGLTVDAGGIIRALKRACC